MIDGMAADTSTMLVLAAIALAEGLGRVPGGSVVLRRFLNGAWQIEGPSGPGDRWRLIHPWPPFTDTLVVRPRSSLTASLSQADLNARMAAVAPARRAARIVGAVTLVLLVVAVPASFAFAGPTGGISAMGGVLAGQLTLGLLGWRGLGKLGIPGPKRARLLAAHLNPFAAPAIASSLFAAATDGASAAAVARTLLSADRWAAWFRPYAYDARLGQPSSRELASSLEAPDDAIAQVLELRPILPSDGLWCPRCSATYQAGASTCADCNIRLLDARQLPLQPDSVQPLR